MKADGGLYPDRAPCGGRRAVCVLLLAVVVLAAVPAPGATGADAALSPSQPPHLVITPRAGIFLVARRGLTDPRFAESVILVTDYGPEGSAGLMVNKATTMTVGATMSEIDALRDNPDPILMGGPVAPNSIRVLVQSEEVLQHGVNVIEHVYFVNTLGMLNLLLAQKPVPTMLHFYAGYAGWGPGQLENEIARGDWHLLKADAASIFTPYRELVWPALIEIAAAHWAHNDAAPARAPLAVAAGLSTPLD